MSKRNFTSEIKALATSENANDWNATPEQHILLLQPDHSTVDICRRYSQQFIFCIDLLEISPHWDHAFYWVEKVEDAFEGRVS